MKIMKAIDTKYKGYKFRSRLEARWAVFFDSLGIKWEYEKEGYNLEGIYYLPDFWLPEVKMWAEVKPEEFNETEIEKASLLSKHSGYPILKLIGIPENKPYDAIHYRENDDNDEPYFEDEEIKRLCSKCNCIMELLYDEYDNDCVFDMTEGQECEYLAGFRDVICPDCGDIDNVLAIRQTVVSNFYCNKYYFYNDNVLAVSDCDNHYSKNIIFLNTSIAVNKARSKRFEFGE